MGSGSGLRVLSGGTLEMIAGGDDAGEDVVVVGKRLVYAHQVTYEYGGGFGGYGYGHGYGYDGGFSYSYEGSGGFVGNIDPPPSTSDEAEVTIVVAVARELTYSEAVSLDRLTETVGRISDMIAHLADDGSIRLNDGRVVSGAELKSLWAKADFIVHDNNIAYENGSFLGEADWNGGNPVIGFNITTLDGYDNLPSGLEYLVLHEIGHLTQIGRDSNAANSPGNEQLANNISGALQRMLGVQPMDAPNGGGYTEYLDFIVPESPQQPSDTSEAGGRDPATGRWTAPTAYS